MDATETVKLPPATQRNLRGKKDKKEKDREVKKTREAKDGREHKEGKDNTGKSEKEKTEQEKLDKEKMELSMSSIVVSLRNLESLFSSLDKKVQANHSELDRKLDRLAYEQRERCEYLEKA